MTEEEAKFNIEQCGRAQQKCDYSSRCPRCGKKNIDIENRLYALSRRADVYVCPECGMDEAIRAMKANPLPLKKWDINKEVSRCLKKIKSK